MTERKDQPKDDWSLTGTVKAYYEAFKGELALGHTQEYLQHMEFMSRFHNYSPLNQALILMQRPDATLVRGYRQWQEMGFQVRRGEKGIAIIAPITANMQVVDLETGEKSWHKQVVGYRDVSVFDRKQLVDDSKIPVFWKKLPDTAKDQQHLVWEAVRACGISVVFADTGRAQGVSKGREIHLNPKLQGDSQNYINTLVHEWAHEMLHRHEQNPKIARHDIPPMVAELQAESIAYVVTNYLGVPSANSRDYILNWRGSVEKLDEHMGVIQETASKMIAKVEEAKKVL